LYFLRDENVEVDDRDPFDTTFAQNILPGKAELRLIEKEILKNTPEVSKLEDRVPGKPMLYLVHRKHYKSRSSCCFLLENLNLLDQKLIWGS